MCGNAGKDTRMGLIKNYIYSFAQQLLTILLPIITMPYVSRVLGAEGVGLYAFSYSIVCYFIVAGTLGLRLYGIKAIAVAKDDKRKLTEVFLHVSFLRIVTFIISGVVFFIMLPVFQTKIPRGILLLQSVNILVFLIDTAWFFIGIEKIKRVVLRNIVVRCLSLFLIFLLVRKRGDVNLYIIIITAGNLIGNLSMILALPGLLDFKKIKMTLENLQFHFLKSMKLFIPQLSMQLHVIVDKTIIGFLSTESQVGYYEASYKIVVVITSLITTLGTIIMPRLSYYHAQQDTEKIRLYIKKTFDFGLYFSIPLVLGLFGISKIFVPVFFGEDFYEAVDILRYLSLICIPVIWRSIIGLQFLIAVNKEKVVTVAILSGTLLNIVLNFMLIPEFKAMGAVVATIMSEVIVSTALIIYVRKMLPLKELFAFLWKYLLSGLFMFLVILLPGNFLNESVFSLILLVGVGFLVYPLVLFLIRSETNTFVIKKLAAILVKRR